MPGNELSFKTFSKIACIAALVFSLTQFDPLYCRAYADETDSNIFACPYCGMLQDETATFCNYCLRAIDFPAAPAPTHRGRIVARHGYASFIRSPNDSYPGEKYCYGSGADPLGPLGSNATLTGFRLLIRFDIMQAFADAGIKPEGFSPKRAHLIIRTPPHGDAFDDIPISVFLLREPFEAGSNYRWRHEKNEPGCNWFCSAKNITWKIPGGDYHRDISTHGTIPGTGEHEIVIDVTALVAVLFERFEKTGKWFDPGMIIMRNPDVSSKCRFRMIYSFTINERPFTSLSLRDVNAKYRGIKNIPRVLSPELYIN